MTQTITLTVSHPIIPPGKIEGFRSLWAFYVNGYKPEFHCQKCFTGRLVDDFSTNTAQSGRAVSLDEMDTYPYVYICGVGTGPKSTLGNRNLHLPLRFKRGAVVEKRTYNGYVFRAENAEELEIPSLPDDWMGLDREHARCKNFQFAVSRFGPT